MPPTSPPASLDEAVGMAAQFPRLRYMGSKHRLVPQLAEIFAEVFVDLAAGVARPTALDAFSGSGVVSYTLKCLGYSVTSNDFLAFPATIAHAAVANQRAHLSAAEVERIIGPPADDRDFIRSTFDGLYFTADDRAFLDSAWSHVDGLRGAKRSLAVSALVLAAARKQPRGVFTVTDLRYDDGRRDLRLPLREHFVEAVADYGAVVFDSGRPCRAKQADVFAVRPGFDLVYLDPPYAPPRDDNCYVKRYHFLEGLSVYWRGQEIMQQTRTKKLAKRDTPFGSKRSVTDALRRLVRRFADSTIVLSYSSNAVPDPETVAAILAEVKRDVEVRRVDHRYHFGTHVGATRREAVEYVYIGR